MIFGKNHCTRHLAITLVALALAQPACDSGGSKTDTSGDPATTPTESIHRGGTVLRHLQSDCKTLNWVLYNTVSESHVLRYLYDSLLDYDENLDIIPVLAESFEVSKDHLRITIRLRDNLHWHDGEALTTADVKFTVDKILDPAIPAVNKEAWFNLLDKVEIVDDRTMVFVWSEPYAPAIHALTQLSPIPEHIYGHGDFLKNPANRAPIGSGAFKFQEWRTADRIIIVANDDYYRERPYLDRVVFRIIPDDGVALDALKAGEIDEMRVRQIQWESLADDADFNRHFSKTFYYVPSYNYLSWNCRSVWFKDRRVRRALTMLFDRKSVIEELYSGYSKIITGPFYVESKAYDRSTRPIPFDPKRASDLLAEAGWLDADNDGVRSRDGVEMEFELFVIAGSKPSLDLAQIFQEACVKAGVRLRIRPIEGATFFDRVFKGQYDAALLAWRLDQDPDLYNTFHSSQVPPVGLNHAFYSNAAVDSLLELGRAEFDVSKRMAIYHQVHRQINEDQPYTFINAVPHKRPISKRIGNVVMSPEGPFNFYPGAIYWYIRDGADK